MADDATTLLIRQIVRATLDDGEAVVDLIQRGLATPEQLGELRAHIDGISWAKVGPRPRVDCES